ncbi:hypothetical protein B0H16DRAFT_1742514 [Mycena metata]|uniref:Uncharacterized protein n=1 Tax=Mycena metata TaxID=1033252 RepID=A0AAD7H961_9AGAR|nr:hypothetical protein B0H16DRAFT_1742514 [Mycena metata]
MAMFWERFYAGGRVFYQGSTPEPVTSAPASFKLFGKLFQSKSKGLAHRDDADSVDRVSIATFPVEGAPSILGEPDYDGDDDNATADDDTEVVPQELDELLAVEAGNFAGDGYPRPAPPQSFIEKMAALEKKQAVAVAPDITSARAALVDIQLVLRGESRGKGGGFKTPDFSPWVRVRMEGIRSHLAQYTNPDSLSYGQWGASARQAAIAVGRGVYCARRFAVLSREYCTITFKSTVTCHAPPVDIEFWSRSRVTEAGVE